MVAFFGDGGRVVVRTHSGELAIDHVFIRSVQGRLQEEQEVSTPARILETAEIERGGHEIFLVRNRFSAHAAKVPLREIAGHPVALWHPSTRIQLATATNGRRTSTVR